MFGWPITKKRSKRLGGTKQQRLNPTPGNGGFIFKTMDLVKIFFGLCWVINIFLKQFDFFILRGIFVLESINGFIPQFGVTFPFKEILR